MSDPIDFFEGTPQGTLIVVRASRRAEGNLELTFQDGEGRLQLVGGVGAKLANLMKGGVQASEHLVESFRQPVQLIAGAGFLQTLGEVFCTDTTGGLRHPVHRPECPTREYPPTPTCQHEDEGEHRPHGQEEAAARDVQVLLRHPDLDQADDTARLDHRHGQYPDRIRPHALHRLESRKPCRGVLEHLRTQRQPPRAGTRPPRIPAPEGIKHLEMAVQPGKTEKTPEDLVNVGGRECGEPLRGLFGQCLGDAIQRGIHVMREAIDQEPIRRAPQEEEGHGQETGVPKGEACPDGPNGHDHSPFNT